eukprot:TRINITY_DN2012_c0_g1_i10.p2 TRINITY_DN2012_c0_g1~~TRINITY_DN2012_c0_g1_i10.p2  ORF type:complete len:194 (+),score=47.00 TRINITY_DN2012_c0_g1_i10:655-1236(+)
MDYFLTANIDTAVSCLSSATNSICAEIDEAITFCLENGLYSIRNHQDRYTELLIEELLNVNRKACNFQYIFLSICIAVILCCVIAITVLIFVVTKNKNTVLSIFAEITKEEIAKTIKRARLIPIRSARFKMKHVTKAKGSEDEYWKRVKDEYATRKEKSLVDAEEGKKVQGEEATAMVEGERNKKKVLFRQME